MDLMERVYESFRDTKCIWEVEIPTAVLSEARERLTALRDLNYRVQFNRKELGRLCCVVLCANLSYLQHFIKVNQFNNLTSIILIKSRYSCAK